MYYTLKIAKRTRGERYTTINVILNSFPNANVLDMPVTAVIFVINKCIANFQNVLIWIRNNQCAATKLSQNTF